MPVLIPPIHFEPQSLMRPLNLWDLFTVRHACFYCEIGYLYSYMYTCEHIEACTRHASDIFEHQMCDTHVYVYRNFTSLHVLAWSYFWVAFWVMVPLYWFRLKCVLLINRVNLRITDTFGTHCFLAILSFVERLFFIGGII